MEKLLKENDFPGFVVIGHLMGQLWWPAVVGRCPMTGEWKDSQGERWVFFFNQDTAAWLKTRDMRPFTPKAHKTIAVLNCANPKFREHLGEIQVAWSLANEYVLSAETPRPLVHYNPHLTLSALHRTATQMPSAAAIQVDCNFASSDFPLNAQFLSKSGPLFPEADSPVDLAAQRVSGLALTSSPVNHNNPERSAAMSTYTVPFNHVPTVLVHAGANSRGALGGDVGSQHEHSQVYNTSTGQNHYVLAVQEAFQNLIHTMELLASSRLYDATTIMQDFARLWSNYENGQRGAGSSAMHSDRNFSRNTAQTLLQIILDRHSTS